MTSERKVMAGAALGSFGGIGFWWVLDHVPPTVAMVLASAAVVGLLVCLFLFKRSISRADKEFAAQNERFLAEMERLRQAYKLGEN